ncbi:hypothetical protein [Aromatoleum aromaticum]|uniref:Uncharacterized protein n=1 Tax=Aromatoleum aromaticum (strain DSM 19018 / LMG 30748 / EbN1) TaxID=76114 RepID=Q5P6D2_AROAE|nr:hypothetical protein [Aromatoleum aromaticum]NMG54920.1 hypothetical protein [Aromatoleum aromaticum]CAI07129.1 hypothetical protein ebA1853 [Aromatoleum aromaticum EbN1]
MSHESSDVYKQARERVRELIKNAPAIDVLALADLRAAIETVGDELHSKQELVSGKELATRVEFVLRCFQQGRELDRTSKRVPDSAARDEA